MQWGVGAAMTDSWNFDDRLRARIGAHLAAHDRRDVHDRALKAAAVCIVVTGDAPSAPAHLLLTQRAARMSRHAGQYALPGGRVDRGETAEQAALRELDEELAVSAMPDQILGVLDDLPTRSGFLVTPYVIWLPPGTRITPDPGEIAELFRVPLADLFAGRGRGDNRGLSAYEEAGDADGLGDGVFSLFIPTLGHDLFAPTAAILDHFREVALLGRDTAVVRFGEPNFARR